MSREVLIRIAILNLFFFSCIRIGIADEISMPIEEGIYLSLGEVSQLALENNLDIQIAKYDAYIKQQDILGAESIFDTVLTAKASYKNDRKNSASSLAADKTTTRDAKMTLSKKIPSGTTLGAELQSTRTWSDSNSVTMKPAYDARAKLSIVQEIGKNFFGLIDRAGIKITKLDIANSDYTSLNTIENDLANVQKSYWNLVLLRQQEEIKKEMLDKAKRLFDIYKDKLQIGLVENTDLFATQANFYLRRNDLLAAEKKSKVANNALLLKLNEDNLRLAIYPEDKLAFNGERKDFYQAITKAIEKNRDYLKALNNVESKMIKVVQKRNSLWPEIDIEASLVRNGISQNYKTAFESITKDNNPESYLGISISIPLENRDARGKFKAAKLGKAKYLLLLKKTEREILVEIDNAVTTANTLFDKARTAQEVAELQQKKLKAEEKNLSFGRSSSDVLIRFQQDLLEAKLAFAQVLYEYRVSLIDLKLAQDVLLDQYWKGKL